MKHSAGILAYRLTTAVEVFLGHFGGPYWTNKDLGAWTIPKGLVEDDEDPFNAARREFEEETGFAPPPEPDPYVSLGTVKQSSSKTVSAWAVEANLDPGALESHPFELEWPPNSGKMQTFPELDRAAYFSLEEAVEKIVDGQRPFLKRLREAVSSE